MFGPLWWLLFGGGDFFTIAPIAECSRRNVSTGELPRQNVAIEEIDQ